MWEVGQTVWCILRGKGKVVEVYKDGVLCTFERSHGNISYNLDGKLGFQLNRSLFFSEPKVEGATEPPFVPLLKRGDKVITIHKEHPGHSSGGKVATFGTVHQEFEKNVVLSNNGLVSFNKEHYLIYKIGEQVY